MSELEQKIAQLEALRPTLGDVAVDGAIAALRGQAATTQITTQSEHVAQASNHAHATLGSAEVSGQNYGPNVGINLGTIIYGRRPQEDEQQQLTAYLHRLANNLQRLRLQGIAARLVREGDGLALPNVYVMLATTSTEHSLLTGKDNLDRYFVDVDSLHLRQEYNPNRALPDQAIIHIAPTYRQLVHDTERDRYETRQGVQEITITRAVAVHDAIRQHRRLILQGEPGSGKSTVLFYLAWLLARRELGASLTATQMQVLAGWRPHLLPIILSMRILADQLGSVSLHDDTVTDPAHLTSFVTQTLCAEMQRHDTQQAQTLLDGALRQGSALICFDGLDEVPIEGVPGVRASRQITLRAVQAFVTTYPDVQVVITCRTGAFLEQYPSLLGTTWHRVTLAPMTLGQVRHFVPLWYNELVQKQYLSYDQAQQYTTALLAAVTDSAHERLCAMSRNPLLLTLMAWVLCERTELPRDRSHLYEIILKLLLEEWDKMRARQTLVDVVGFHNWDSTRLRPILYDRINPPQATPLEWQW